MENPNIPPEKIKEFEEKMKNFQYIRQNRASLFQGIFVALLTSALVLLVNLISEEDISLQIVLIILIILIAWQIYVFSLKQTQKPIFVCENAVGTIEGKPVEIKGKDGNDYLAFKLSDFIHQSKENKK